MDRETTRRIARSVRAAREEIESPLGALAIDLIAETIAGGIEDGDEPLDFDRYEFLRDCGVGT